MTISSYSRQYLDAIPIGEMIPWAAASVPAGFVAQASVISRTTYPAAFAHFGTTWGSGDGSTTFSVPFGDPRTLPWNVPRGWLGSAQITAAVTIAATATDIPGLSVTFTAYANRRYRITAQGGLDNAAATAQGIAFYVREGSTTIGAIFQSYLAANGIAGDQEFGAGVWEGTFSAGAHTVKVSANASTGATSAFTAAATVPGQLIVEDIGADITQTPYSVGQWIVKVQQVQPTAVGAPYEVCTSSTRPTGYEGKVIWETDTKLEWVYSGSAYLLKPGQSVALAADVPSTNAIQAGATLTVRATMRTWQKTTTDTDNTKWVCIADAGAGRTFSPTVKFGTTVQTLTQNNSQVKLVNGRVTWTFEFMLGTPSGSGVIYFTPPFVPRGYGSLAQNYMRPVGIANAITVPGGAVSTGIVVFEGGSPGQFYARTNSRNGVGSEAWSNIVPSTWASTYEFFFQIDYDVATILETPS